MGAKPGDFFLRVVEFFGILVPGAVFLFLVFFQHKWIGLLLDLGTQDIAQVSTWVKFVITSFILGQFLAIISVPLNGLLERATPAAEDEYYKRIKERVLLPGEKRIGNQEENSPHGASRPSARKFPSKQFLKWGIDTLFHYEERSSPFYRALAFIRLHEKTSALADIEQQMAEYKLFRSLVVVFLLDLLLWALGFAFPPLILPISLKTTIARIILSLALCLFAAARFLHLLKWTYRITFEYYALLDSEGIGIAKAAAVGQDNAV